MRASPKSGTELAKHPVTNGDRIQRQVSELYTAMLICLQWICYSRGELYDSYISKVNLAYQMVRRAKQ